MTGQAGGRTVLDMGRLLMAAVMALVGAVGCAAASVPGEPAPDSGPAEASSPPPGAEAGPDLPPFDPSLSHEQVKNMLWLYCPSGFACDGVTVQISATELASFFCFEQPDAGGHCTFACADQAARDACAGGGGRCGDAGVCEP